MNPWIFQQITNLMFYTHIYIFAVLVINTQTELHFSINTHKTPSAKNKH